MEGDRDDNVSFPHYAHRSWSAMRRTCRRLHPYGAGTVACRRGVGRW